MFDWNEYIDFAEKIKNETACDECQCRVAISRLYYGILHLCKDFAETNALFDMTMYRSNNIHKIWDEFMKIEEYKKICTEGGRLRTKRVDSDYHPEKTLDKRDLTHSFCHANAILGIINKEHS